MQRGTECAPLKMRKLLTVKRFTVDPREKTWALLDKELEALARYKRDAKAERDLPPKDKESIDNEIRSNPAKG